MPLGLPEPPLPGVAAVQKVSVGGNMKLEAQEVQLSSGGTAVVYGCGCVEIVQSDKTESDLGLIVTADDIALLHTITAAIVRQNEIDDR